MCRWCPWPHTWLIKYSEGIPRVPLCFKNSLGFCWRSRIPMNISGTQGLRRVSSHSQGFRWTWKVGHCWKRACRGVASAVDGFVDEGLSHMILIPSSRWNSNVQGTSSCLQREWGKVQRPLRKKITWHGRWSTHNYDQLTSHAERLLKFSFIVNHSKIVRCILNYSLVHPWCVSILFTHRKCCASKTITFSARCS